LKSIDVHQCHSKKFKDFLLLEVGTQCRLREYEPEVKRYLQ